jgi:hypothetical protein
MDISFVDASQVVGAGAGVLGLAIGVAQLKVARRPATYRSSSDPTLPPESRERREAIARSVLRWGIGAWVSPGFLIVYLVSVGLGATPLVELQLLTLWSLVALSVAGRIAGLLNEVSEWMYRNAISHDNEDLRPQILGLISVALLPLCGVIVYLWIRGQLSVVLVEYPQMFREMWRVATLG